MARAFLIFFCPLPDAMLRVSVGSLNPAKLEAVKRAFIRFFPGRDVEVTGFNAPSGISEQPMGDDETRRGALNRCAATAAASPDADFAVGLEGGCAECRIELPVAAGAAGPRGRSVDYLECFAWMAVCEPRSGKFGWARTGSFQLPEAVAELVRAGVELGVADDRVFGRTNSKQGTGAVGLLTRGAVTRADYYEHALQLALVPFGLVEHYNDDPRRAAPLAPAEVPLPSGGAA